MESKLYIKRNEDGISSGFDTSRTKHGRKKTSNRIGVYIGESWTDTIFIRRWYKNLAVEKF